MMKVDYSKATFKMLCLRKHLLKDITYFLYVVDNVLYLSNELESQQPKYQIPITLENKLSWSLDKDRQLTQFGFEYKGQIKFFFGRDEELRMLKEKLRNKIMFKDVSDFYQPMKLLGRGGSAKVYLVIEKDSKLDYASKCVEKRYLREDGGYQALFNEINIMAQLDQESIVKLEEVYEGENTFYLVLEYLKGSSLHEAVGRGSIQAMSWDQIKTVMWQILNGVACMHKNGIMHRDLKPENIMFKEQNTLNNLRIVDFGLATQTNVATYPFPKCGTPGYVAPEIANLKDLTFKYDKICDLFSVGCIFYKLITQKDLFPGSDYHEILKLNKKCNINLDALSIYRTPQTAIDLITQLLQPNPQQRITAEKALEHQFFIAIPNDRKVKFQAQKRKEPAGKLWQTQNFRVDKSDKLQLPEIKNKSKQREDEVEDEKIQIKVPILNSPRLAHHAQRKNLALADSSPEIQKKAIFKKFSTQEFEALSPDQQSPDSARGHPHPTLIMNTPSIFKQEQSQSSIKKKSIIMSNFSKYQQQAIQEVEDEQKNN